MLRRPMKTRLPSSSQLSSQPPDELSQLLEEIEHEEMPERLLTLARRLQTALAAQRDDRLEAVSPLRAPGSSSGS